MGLFGGQTKRKTGVSKEILLCQLEEQMENTSWDWTMQEQFGLGFLFLFRKGILNSHAKQAQLNKTVYFSISAVFSFEFSVVAVHCQDFTSHMTQSKILGIFPSLLGSMRNVPPLSSAPNHRETSQPVCLSLVENGHGAIWSQLPCPI